MKKLFWLLAMWLVVFPANAQQSVNNEAEINLIRKVIQTAYVEGLQNEGDTVKINMGFHPGFELLIPEKDGKLTKLSLAEWKGKIKASLASGKLPRKDPDKVSIKFLNVDVTGDAAMAKFEFYVGARLTFVDYQFLYKFGEDWKIVSKIFYKY